MKTKSFQAYLDKRLDKAEIAELEKLAKLEFDIMKSFQEDIANAVATYMTEENIGFNELTRRLNISPTQASRIRSGSANLTLATVAHIFALLKQRAHFAFGHKSIKKNKVAIIASHAKQ